MNALRRNIFKILLVLASLALPGADVECEDGELEFDWPDVAVYEPVHYDHYDHYYVEPDCCWY